MLLSGLLEGNARSKVDLSTPISSIANKLDSVQKDGLFFAIQGTNFDSHALVDEAQKRGAFVVVEKEDVFQRCASAILVPSTRKALAFAASRWFASPSENFRLVGVTGTNGKTTVTFLLNQIWERMGMVAGLVGTVEYRIGTKKIKAPLTTPDPLVLQDLFSQMEMKGVKFAAMEVSSIALDQCRAWGSRFDVAVFTNLTHDHLDYHGSMERYFACKEKLFMEYQPRISIVNIDDKKGKELFEKLSPEKRLGFSIETDADFSVVSHSLDADGIRATLKTPMGNKRLSSPLVGRHNLSNLMSALATNYALGFDINDTIEALTEAPGAPGRLERVSTPSGGPRVFVDYAHTDDALQNVLRSLNVIRGNSRLLTVFGCGGDRDRMKRPKMGKIASEWSDVTIVTSDNPRTESPEAIIDDIEPGVDRKKTEYIRNADRRKAIDLALAMAEPNDIVLIAGKGHETYQIVGTESLPFDDREVVRDHY